MLINCGKLVKLTEGEYIALAEKYGAGDLALMIHKINDYYESSGKDIPKIWPPVIHRWFDTEWPDKPSASGAVKAESALTFLQSKFGMDRVKIDKSNIIHVTGTQGNPKAQFERKDLDGAKKWYAQTYGDN